MKRINLQLLVFSLMTIGLLSESCKKDESCPTINCNTGTQNEETCNCDCPVGFSGTNCETEDLCITQSVVCENGGTCVNGDCECPEGFIGTNCEAFDPAKVQAILDGGKTPMELFTGNIPLDSIYGKYYEGGFIFYLNTSEGTGLICASEDLSEEYAWGCVGSLMGANGVSVGTGFQNTLTIVSGCNEIGSAARICNDLVMNGKEDWFLPSKDELNLMWTNLADSDGNDINTGLDDPNNLGKFKTDWYWCSSETGDVIAFIQLFYDGFQGNGVKEDVKPIRPVRVF
jgi:hypothetical protein